ncbi:hypothetical protein KAZ57_01400 [Patescibacteria group bacterium]|nr:hypothetical protein [Patescibacteria group bacterium]
MEKTLPADALIEINIPKAESLGLEISRRDITEYEYIQRAAQLLRNGAEILFEGKELSEFTAMVTDEYDHKKISRLQHDAFIQGIEHFAQNVEQFENYLITVPDSKLLEGISETVSISRDELPGVVIFRATSEEDYMSMLNAIGRKDIASSNGAFITTTRNFSPELQKRIIYLSMYANQRTLRHEYLHFLYHTFLDNEVQPHIGDQYMNSPSKSKVDNRITTLQNQVMDAEEKLENTWQNPTAALKAFNTIKASAELETAYGERLVAAEEQKSIGTYTHKAHSAFLKARDELKSYFWDATMKEDIIPIPGGIKDRAIQESKKDKTPYKIFGPYAAEVMDPTTPEMIVLQNDWLTFARTLTALKLTATEKEEIAPVILASRNFEQAAKFMYLYKKSKKEH